MSRSITKFPGGGLIWGEGIEDCLKREWMEELNTEIEIIRHFYTTGFFQASAFDDSQVISIYYMVHSTTELKPPLSNEREVFEFLNIDDLLHQKLTFPIDQLVGKMIFDQLSEWT